MGLLDLYVSLLLCEAVGHVVALWHQWTKSSSHLLLSSRWNFHQLAVEIIGTWSDLTQTSWIESPPGRQKFYPS
jgi:hypothetical protein